MLKALSSKVKKHIGTVGYYAEAQANEMSKVEVFLNENGVNNVEINIALAGVKSGEIAADVAIAKIEDVLKTEYAEVFAAEEAAREEEKAQKEAAKKEAVAKARAEKKALKDAEKAAAKAEKEAAKMAEANQAE